MIPSAEPERPTDTRSLRNFSSIMMNCSFGLFAA
nr:MAG TPA: hypothetical protein [Caudoviricetes sp.]